MSSKEEKNAIDAGAHIISEIVVGITIFLLIFLEYSRYAKRSKKLLIKSKEDNIMLNAKICKIEYTVQEHAKCLEELLHFTLQLRDCVRRVSTLNQNKEQCPINKK